MKNLTEKFQNDPTARNKEAKVKLVFSRPKDNVLRQRAAKNGPLE